MVHIGKIRGDDPKQWTWNPIEHYLGNSKFGRIQVLAVCDEFDNLQYTQPVLVQHQGEFYVVVDDNGRIAFLLAQHPAVIPIERYHRTWGRWRPLQGSNTMLIPHPADLHDQGVTLLELPRDLASTTLQEAEEKTHHKVSLVTSLGYLNPDSSFYGTTPEVILCKASPFPADVSPDPNERILEILWLVPEKAREVETLSMHTYASLFLFRRWALKQADPFWKEIGERL